MFKWFSRPKYWAYFKMISEVRVMVLSISMPIRKWYSPHYKQKQGPCPVFCPLVQHRLIRHFLIIRGLLPVLLPGESGKAFKCCYCSIFLWPDGPSFHAPWPFPKPLPGKFRCTGTRTLWYPVLPCQLPPLFFLSVWLKPAASCPIIYAKAPCEILFCPIIHYILAQLSPLTESWLHCASLVTKWYLLLVSKIKMHRIDLHPCSAAHPHPPWCTTSFAFPPSQGNLWRSSSL